MTNDITLVPKEEQNDATPPQVSRPSSKKEKLTSLSADKNKKKLPADQQDIPVNNWIMPPEQQGYIQGNDNDCL